MTSAFEALLAAAAVEGKRVNTLFEQKFFELLGVLEGISHVFASNGIAHEVIGGVAVAIYVEEVSPERTALTRDVDLLVNRAELGRIKVAAAGQGFRFRHTAGPDMLIFGKNDSAREAVHLIFSEEKVRNSDLIPAPAINPVKKQIRGRDVMVIPLEDLLRMKLNSFRLSG